MQIGDPLSVTKDQYVSFLAKTGSLGSLQIQNHIKNIFF